MAGFPIDRADVVPFSVPLRDDVRLSRGSLNRRSGWLLRLESGGLTGWGEASPLAGYSVERIGDVPSALGELAAALTGESMDADGPIAWVAQRLERAEVPPSVRFALELAALNLAAARTGRTAASLIHPDARAGCAVAALVFGDGDAAVASAKGARDAGFAAVKLKVGRRSVARDADTVRAVADSLGGATALRLDANRAWSWDDALRFAAAIDGVAVEFIEEPLADPSRLARFVDESGLPVALDETVVAAAPDRLVLFGGLKAVIVKPTLIGGLAIAMKIGDRCAAAGVDAIVSSSFESGIGLHGLAALAAALPSSAGPAGLGTAAFLGRDVIEPPFPAGVSRVSVTGHYRVLEPRDTPGTP